MRTHKARRTLAVGLSATLAVVISSSAVAGNIPMPPKPTSTPAPQLVENFRTELTGKVTLQ